MISDFFIARPVLANVLAILMVVIGGYNSSNTQALAQVAMKMGQAIYEKEQAAGASPQPETAAADDGVVDAEFSEVDDSAKA